MLELPSVSTVVYLELCVMTVKKMMRFRISILLIITMLTIQSYGQQDTKYSLFWNNLSIYNPAKTGIRGPNSQSLFTNGQIPTVGNDSTSIRSFNVIYDINLGSSKNGIGINFQQDKVGSKINNQANFNYARWMPLGKGDLSIGIAVGYASDNFFNLNGGLMYTTNRLLTGFGVTHINHSNYEPLKYNFSKTQNYYFNYQYAMMLGQHLMIMPMVFIRSIISNTDADMSIQTQFYKNFIVGLGYRTSKAILFTAGIIIKNKISLTYAYNYVKPNSTILNKSSHEVALRVKFK